MSRSLADHENDGREHLIRRLHKARAALDGLDRGGVRAYPGMFDATVVSFAHGDGTRRPHHSVIRAGVEELLDANASALDDYLFGQRHEEFESAVIESFISRGLPPDTAGNVVVDAGVTSLFLSFLGTCAATGDTFVVPRSYYHVLPAWCDFLGIRLQLLSTEQRSSYKVTPEVLERHCQEARAAGGVRGLFLFNPTQTGALYTREELIELAAVIDQYDLVVLEDAVFAGTEFPGETLTLLSAACPGISHRVVTVTGASKAHNLSNMRIGWACGPKDYIERMSDIRELTMGNVPHVTQTMALAALRAPSSYCLENAAENKSRASLVANLISICNTEVYSASDSEPVFMNHSPQAGHGVLVSMPGLLSPATCITRLDTSVAITSAILRHARVAMPPGYSLGFDGPEVRLALGSVGLKQTYADTAAIEATEALTAVLRRLELLGNDKAYGPHGLASPHSPVSAEAQFASGRSIIEDAFIRRLIPAWSMIQKEVGEST